jgi:hypothetical protein
MDESEQIIKKRFAELPEDVRKAITSVNTVDVILKLGQKHALHIDQTGDLENETSFILLGFEHPSEYVNNISKALNVPEVKARAIAQDVNEQIFRPIRDSLQKMHGVVAGVADNKSVAQKILEKSFVPKKPEIKIPPYIPPIPPRQNPFKKPDDQILPKTNPAPQLAQNSPSQATTKPSTNTPPANLPTENMNQNSAITAHVEAYQKKMDEKARKEQMDKNQNAGDIEAGNISKETLLQGIENPGSIGSGEAVRNEVVRKETPTIEMNQNTQTSPIKKEYGNDPYREPTT